MFKYLKHGNQKNPKPEKVMGYVEWGPVYGLEPAPN